jgi:L-arabinokinase
MSSLLQLDPIPTLLSRLRRELSDAFRPDRPIRVSRAPGRLDMMGGIAHYSGSHVCGATIDRAAAVALQGRDDRQVQVFSFNLLDEHKPFTFRIPLDALASQSAEALRREFAEPGRRWAANLAGCLFTLHERGMLNLAEPAARGVNLAAYSTVPMGAGLGASSAMTVAAMMNLADHFGVRGERLGGPVELAALCREVEQRIGGGAPCDVTAALTSCLGESGKLHRILCQPHELLEPLTFPNGVRVVGIDSGTRCPDGSAQYARVRCAAFMGHKIILEKMRYFGRAAGRALERDPLSGYLANLDPEDYKKYFRPYLPESLKGGEFLLRFGRTIDTATTVHPDERYPVRNAVDHHVLEAMRVKHFVELIEEAAALAPADPRRRGVLDKAGHLMYASHFAYGHDAHLSAPECDVLVELVREHETMGLYGARITGQGEGGTVAVLAEVGASADAAIEKIMDAYERRSGRKAQTFQTSGGGAWEVGTAIVNPVAQVP